MHRTETHSERKRKNTIKKLRKEDVKWIKAENYLKEHVASYFINLFTVTSRPSSE